MGASVDGKAHVSNLSLQPDSFKIAKVTGIGPTTRHTEVDSAKSKLADDAWHTVVWEIQGDEMVACIDDRDRVPAKAEADDKWPQKRAQLMTRRKKKEPKPGGK